ncbi:hypothetical protein X805_15090 [Sphaerotilus natans subsp. natans DSM 6575]|uniref:Uncharacterized protein n=1 Tax=Sphaerotilus natans subsp. natans DSM 6575 TaxID=1286631 RepID=A0A059KNF3_9BURK|nr:hypothetical protein X805_15090 [Sphaerotilus natans subsp. natans DSM 6575]
MLFLAGGSGGNVAAQGTRADGQRHCAATPTDPLQRLRVTVEFIGAALTAFSGLIDRP